MRVVRLRNTFWYWSYKCWKPSESGPKGHGIILRTYSQLSWFSSNSHQNQQHEPKTHPDMNKNPGKFWMTLDMCTKHRTWLLSMKLHNVKFSGRLTAALPDIGVSEWIDSEISMTHPSCQLHMIAVHNKQQFFCVWEKPKFAHIHKTFVKFEAASYLGL